MVMSTNHEKSGRNAVLLYIVQEGGIFEIFQVHLFYEYPSDVSTVQQTGEVTTINLHISKKKAVKSITCQPDQRGCMKQTKR